MIYGFAELIKVKKALNVLGKELKTEYARSLVAISRQCEEMMEKISHLTKYLYIVTANVDMMISIINKLSKGLKC